MGIKVKKCPKCGTNEWTPSPHVCKECGLKLKASPAKRARWYSVFGTYRDNDQRYATSLQATSPKEAEKLAQEGCARDNKMDHSEPLLVSAVIEGKHEAKDRDPVYEGGIDAVQAHLSERPSPRRIHGDGPCR